MKAFMNTVRASVCIVLVLATAARAATNTIQVLDFDFGTAPSTHVDPTINFGDTVEWVWASGATPHSTTAAAGQLESWNSGLQTQPFTFDHAFGNAGTFNYYCSLHGADAGGGNVSGMSGHVTVLSGIWAGSVDGGAGWRYLAWFGYFKVAGNWVYHSELGWMYAVGTSPSSIWLWSPGAGAWLWSSSTVYPFFWNSGSSVWLYYYVGTGNGSGGWFYNYGTSTAVWL